MIPKNYGKAKYCGRCGCAESEDGDTLYCKKYQRDVGYYNVCDRWGEIL